MTEDDDIDGLAGEYVLGSLDPAERADIHTRLRADLSLVRAIEAWQRRLSPLSEAAPRISPPSHLFGSILSRISGETGKQSAQMVALHPDRKSWRSISIVGGALAACVALAIGWSIYTRPGTSPKHVAAMDCSRLYKEFWGRLENENYARISVEHLAGDAVNVNLPVARSVRAAEVALNTWYDQEKIAA
jgi:anti-sigma-K factor RskA